ncbi:hypothetical protein WJX73_005194 [Symbiochloris irregularis]|uniref:Uncharacterized protein n=1 Tax=Symbiochloris irregularis TaxID=706552 RepID=A0AAW1NPN6_9CHLO
MAYNHGFDSVGFDVNRPPHTNTQESDDPHVPDPKLDIALDSGFDATEEHPRGADPKVPAVTVASPEPSAANNWRDPSVRVRYAILDVPPWWECLFLGFQHYLTMLGSTVLIPFLLVPAMGGTSLDLAHVIGTIFFVSGWITLLQTVVGDRLPIVQGGSFAYLTPAFSLIFQVKGNIEALGLPPDDPESGVNHERFLYTMRLISGGIVGSSFFIMFIGGSGILSLIIHWISPITVAANIAVVGLALYTAGFTFVGLCPQLGLPLIFFIILFSQYMKNITIPLPFIGKLRLFELFPVLLGIAFTWIYGIIVTAAGAYGDANNPNEFHQYCRTDQSHVLSDSSWFRWPYPGQWGGPILTWSSVLTMLAGALSAMVESLGDYYAAARIAGAPVPPPEIIARAVFVQGFSCMITGFVGTANGTTAYNENIGAMQITRVGSRRVIQVGSCIIIIVALIGKFGGLFASMPIAMVGGLFCVMFGLIAAVGLSQLQFTDMNSPRNIFIVGFGLFMGLTVPYYFTYYYEMSCTEPERIYPINTSYNLGCKGQQHYPINTGDTTFNRECLFCELA